MTLRASSAAMPFACADPPCAPLELALYRETKALDVLVLDIFRDETRICFARSAQCKVLLVSLKTNADGDKFAIMAVMHPPPSESLSSCVSLLFR